MANEDSFISEVTEEVRRDRLFALMRRYGWIAVLAVVVVVGGASWNEWRKASERSAAEAKGDAVIRALQEETAEGRVTALSAVTPSDTPEGQAILALLTAAAEAEAGDREAEAATLDRIATNMGFPSIYRDIATLKRVMTGAGTLSPEDRIARLEPLFAPGNPLRLLAVEQRAFAEIALGDTDAALSSLRGILEDAEVTEDLRRRARQLIVALGGQIDQG